MESLWGIFELAIPLMLSVVGIMSIIVYAMIYFNVFRNTFPKGKDKKLTDEFYIKVKLLIQSTLLMIVIVLVGSAWNVMPNEELILFTQSIGGVIGGVCVISMLYINHINNKEVEEYKESLTIT